MTCNDAPWCTTDHERLIGGDWEPAGDGQLVRYHERSAGRLIYLVAVERAGTDGATLSVPRISVNGEDEQLDAESARLLAADLLRLAAIADGAA